MAYDAFVFRGEVVQGERTKFLRNVGNHSPSVSLSLHESSETPLIEPEVLHSQRCTTQASSSSVYYSCVSDWFWLLVMPMYLFSSELLLGQFSVSALYLMAFMLS